MENMEYVHFPFEGKAYIIFKTFNQAKGRIKGTQKKQKQKKKKTEQDGRNTTKYSNS